MPDNLKTVKFLLGAIDDLLEYYSTFPNMNARPTEDGLAIDSQPGAWFNDHHIMYRYRLRRFNVPWMALVSRSCDIIKMIDQHDWLRRRGGVLDRKANAYFTGYFTSLVSLMRSNGGFHELKTPDFTTNSRRLLADLVATATSNGLTIRTGTEVVRIHKDNGGHEVITDKGSIHADRLVLCSGKNIRNFVDVRVKTSYAPIAVVAGLENDAESFVRLDYLTKTCINLLVKDGGVGQAGGISLGRKSACAAYMDYVMREHRKIHPNLEVLGTYIGEKDEITFRGQNRNYLYHIVEWSENLWAVVPGKFTLAFSLAPEFFRRVYGRNPSKYPETQPDDGCHRSLIAETYWQEFVRRHSGRSEPSGTRSARGRAWG